MATSGTRKTGDWALARQLLSGAPARLQAAARQALLQEAQALRNDIVRGLTSQAPGGQAFTPLAPLTLAARVLKGIGGSKALIANADLRNAIGVVPGGDEVFVGVPRSAQSKDGEGLVHIAVIHEFGAGPVAVPLTPAMRRFLFVLLKSAGVAPRSGSHGGGGAGVIIVRIPPRPFLRPPFQVFQRVAPKRFLNRVARALNMGSQE
jgi:hypothetical protein